MDSPAGIPASSASLISAKADKGVSSAGLKTHVHPAAKAAPFCKGTKKTLKS